MTISEIARKIKADWKDTKNGINFAAKPYLDCLVSESGTEFGESTKSHVLYFLSNASTYRTANAKKYKTLLKAAIGEKLTKAERELILA